MNLITRSALGLAVCMALGTSAHALSRAEYAAATKVYFGGATATDNTLEELFLSNVASLCDATLGTPDIWRAANQRVITCKVSRETMSGNTSIPTRASGGLAMAFHKESEGGSSNGVVPLIAVANSQAHDLRWLNVGALANDCTTSTVTDPNGNLMTYTQHANCTLDATTYTPVDTVGSSTYDVHGGISDTEPSLSYPKPSSQGIAKLVSQPGLDIVFGVPVTKALYRALQKAQFGNGSSCDGSDATTCVPSLTRAQIRGLYTQSIVDWNEIKDPNGTALLSVPGVVAPTDELVRICRRVSSSGTQASFESYWLNQRCVNGVPPFALPDDASTIDDNVYSANQFAGGSLVNAAPSSGNVRSCLQSANTGNFWGVGVLSTEVTDSNLSGAGDSFRFIGVDGAAPTLANVANGDYDFFTQNTVNRINTGNPGTLGTTDARRIVIDTLRVRLGTTAVLANLNATFDLKPWGNGGVLAPSSNSLAASTAPFTPAELSTTPVNTQSRNGNNCAPPFMVKQQPINGTPNP